MLKRCAANLLQHRMLPSYTRNPTSHNLPTAYILLDHTGPDVGQMLSNTWELQRANPCGRGRLFKDRLP